MLATALLLGLILLAAATDLLQRKIYNWTVYPGILAGLGLNAAGWGLVEPADSLLGLVACGLLMLFCYVSFRIGGGDVKLITMLGAFLGLEDGIKAMLWTFVLGGCLGVIVLIWQVGPLRLLRGALRHTGYLLRSGRFAGLSEAQREALQPRLYLAPCALVAVVLVRFVPL